MTDPTDGNQRKLGRKLGKSGQTIGRWSSDLEQWKGKQLLDAAREDETLGGLVVAYVRDEQTTTARGEAVAVVGDLMRVMGDGGVSINTIVQAVADGRVTDDENLAVDAALTQLEADIAAARRDLAAQRVKQ